MTRTLKRKKRRSSRKIIFIFLSLLSIAAFIYLNGKGFFNITDINIQGNFSVTQSQILNASGLKPGDNLLMISTKRVENAIKSIIGVKDVKVKKLYPTTLKISIIERNPFAVILSNAIYYEVDSDGIILTTYDNASGISSVIISGSSIVIDNDSPAVVWSSDSNLKTAYDVISFLLSENLYANISELHISDKSCYYLYSNKANVIKFYSLNAFETNKNFISEFLKYEERKIMVEVVEGVNPVYKEIDIK